LPIFNLWLENSGLSGLQIGFVATVPWVVMLIIQPLWGILGDRMGKLVCFRIALIFAALLFALFPLVATDKISVVVMTILFSLFQTPVLPLLDSLTLEYHAEDKLPSYSTIRFWGAPGFGIGALLTGFLMSTTGSDIAFYLCSAFLLGSFTFSFSLASVKSFAASEEVTFKGAGKVLQSGALLKFLLIIMIVSIAQSSSTFFMAVYMKEISASPLVTGYALAVQAASELPFYFVASWLLRKTTAEKILLIAVFGTSIRLMLYYFTGNPNLVIAIELLNGVTWTLLWIASVEFVNKNVPPAWRATGQSLLWAVYFGAGAIAGNLLTAKLYEIFPMRSVFGINSVIVFIVLLISLVVFSKPFRCRRFRLLPRL